MGFLSLFYIFILNSINTAYMKKTILFGLLLLSIQYAQASTAAQARAARLGKGMNLAVWLESSYWFFNTTAFPDVTRYTEADIINLHNLCFQTVRLPVFFEPFAGTSAPYTFDMSNPNVVQGLNYVDSVIAWTGRYNMTLVIDNHLADDDNTYGLQTNYQITDANYAAQAQLMCAVWRQVIGRYSYADPDRVYFELRNEPNSVSDANLHIVYQTLIDTVRKYDNSHTLIVGNTGYYDPVLLAGSTPYTDTNLIYTFHIYDGDQYYGFCFQGQGGIAATDTVSGTHISFARYGAQAADITSEVQNVHNWAVANSVPVWLSEFGCTTLPEVYHDDTSRCNYFENFGAILDSTATPWSYWDGYGPDEYVTSYDGGTTLTYLFSVFDRSNVLTAAHINPCFASALHVAGQCAAPSGVHDLTGTAGIALYPNPTSGELYINAPLNEGIAIYNAAGLLMASFTGNSQGATVNTSSYAAGVYLVRVLATDGSYITKRFVKE
jgi:hypothetical protein